MELLQCSAREVDSKNCSCAFGEIADEALLGIKLSHRVYLRQEHTLFPVLSQESRPLVEFFALESPLCSSVSVSTSLIIQNKSLGSRLEIWVA